MSGKPKLRTCLWFNGQGGDCGWVEDRFGVSWQVLPQVVPEMMMADDRAAAGRAHQATMAVTTIDIAALKAAFAGR